ncbi:MAG: LPS export ABC transporter periplasmic protein LptC [Campylobacterota bacterium]|nr:LPS export ABC transporter periplasmic protein LptC [Campylobacterota bacterium]
MGITKFIYLLLIVAIGFLFYKQESDVKIVNSQKKPLLVFENSIAYDISQKGVTKIVEFEKTLVYDNYEKSFDATIVSRDDKNSTTNILSAKKMIKRGDKLSLAQNIHLLNDEDFNLETEELQYNLKTQIAQNSTTFRLEKASGVLNGENLYFDATNNNIEASKTHFKIKLKDLDETK